MSLLDEFINKNVPKEKEELWKWNSNMQSEFW